VVRFSFRVSEKLNIACVAIRQSP